jgi:hypothetical protein
MTLKASGENCDFLMAVYKEYVRPNMLGRGPRR